MKIRSADQRIILTEEQVQQMHENNVERAHVYNRVLKLGWTVDKAVSTPVRREKRYGN